MKNSINFVLQGKGGVGKSFVASILAQYFLDQKQLSNVVIADTDPVNSTTAKVKRLNAEVVKIMEHNQIIQSKFDSMFESILSTNHTFVIDNGASTFLPLLQYFSDNCVMDLFNEVEQDVYIHTIIVGGQAQADTLEGFESISEMVKGTKVKIVLWMNEFQGSPSIEGIPLQNTKFFSKNSSVLSGVVVIKDRKSDAFDSDIKKMSEKSLTLVEVQESEGFGLMAKSRIWRVFNEIYSQLDTVFDKDAA